MKQVLTLVTLSLLPLITYSNVAVIGRQGQVWQADVQIRTLGSSFSFPFALVSTGLLLDAPRQLDRRWFRPCARQSNAI